MLQKGARAGGESATGEGRQEQIIEQIIKPYPFLLYSAYNSPFHYVSPDDTSEQSVTDARIKPKALHYFQM